MHYNPLPVTEAVLATPKHRHLNLELLQRRFKLLGQNRPLMNAYGTQEFCYQAELAESYAMQLALRLAGNVGEDEDDDQDTAEFCHMLPLLASEQVLVKDADCTDRPHQWVEIEFAICYNLDPETTSEYVSSVLRCFEESACVSRIVRHHLTPQSQAGVPCAVVESVTALKEVIPYITRSKAQAEKTKLQFMSIERFVARMTPFGPDADLVFGETNEDGSLEKGILHRRALPFLQMHLGGFEQVDLTDRLAQEWLAPGDEYSYSRLVHNKPTKLDGFSLVFA